MMTHRTCQAVDGLNALEVESAATSPVGEDGQPAPARKLIACRAQKKAERTAELRRKFNAMRQDRNAQFSGANVYVKNLSEDVDDDELRTLFTKYGELTSSKVMMDEAGRSKVVSPSHRARCTRRASASCASRSRTRRRRRSAR